MKGCVTQDELGQRKCGTLFTISAYTGSEALGVPDISEYLPYLLVGADFFLYKKKQTDKKTSYA